MFFSRIELTGIYLKLSFPARINFVKSLAESGLHMSLLGMIGYMVRGKFMKHMIV